MSQTQIRADAAPAEGALRSPPGAPGEAPAASPGASSRHADWWFPLLAFGLIAGTIITVSIVAHTHLPLLHHRHRLLQGKPWLNAFTWWDGWWYVGIARRGYLFFHPERQSPVAFFPLYPLMIREVARVVGGPVLAGFLLCVGSGLGATVVFHRWCLLRFGPSKARLAVLLLLLYPFAFYLMGAIYADALFLMTAAAAFLAIEQDRPVLAGMFGALATATRPVGIAVVVGLWLVALERKGVIGRPQHERVGFWGFVDRLRPPHMGLLLAPVGLVSFCVFLWVRFSRPFVFLDVTGAPGWDQPPGFHTWFKVHWIKAMWHGPWINGHIGHLFINALATVVVAAFIPAVFRRLGWGYGMFAVITVVLTAISTKDFVGMGRYTLAAFPCFAVAADSLSRRPWLARVTLGVCALGLLLLAELHARGTIIS